MYILSVDWRESLRGYESHYHDAHELLYIVEGEIRVTVNGRQLRAAAGELLIFSRFESHSVQVLSPTYRRFTLLISPEISVRGENYLLSSVLVNRSSGVGNIVPCGESGKAVAAILEDMYREYREKKPMHETVLDALLTRLLCQVYRITPQLFVSADDKNTGIIRHLQTRFERDYTEHFCLSDLALAYHVSASHLVHTFKKITGYSPMDYLMSCRVSAAKRLLAGSDKPVGEIAELCGFADESNFSRAFRTKVGMTPSAFRKQNARKLFG